MTGNVTVLRDGEPPLPTNQVAEQALLGAILVNNVALERDGVGQLLPEHFSVPVHGRIFQAARTLWERNQLADPVTLKAGFDNDPDLSDAGGSGYLGRLAASAVTIIHADDYAREIRSLAIKRGLATVGQEIWQLALKAGPDLSSDECLAEAERQIAALGDAMAPQQPLTAALDAVDEGLRTAEEAYRNEGRISGQSTGLIDLDRALGGLNDEELVIIAGRPGMGKSALATGIAQAVAEALGERNKARQDGDDLPEVAAIFSLEMSRRELALRMLGAVTGISAERVRTGRIGAMDWGVLMQARARFHGLPLYIDDSPVVSVAHMRMRARRVARRARVRLVVVDYLQLIKGSGRPENRTQEISQISRELKILAKELHCPVIALSQLSRDLERRESQRPMLSDLRESGSLEQDADVVVFVYRDEVYVAQREPRRNEKDRDDTFADRLTRWTAQMDAVRGLAELIVAKNRHGRGRTVACRFDDERAVFQSLQRDEGPLP